MVYESGGKGSEWYKDPDGKDLNGIRIRKERINFQLIPFESFHLDSSPPKIILLSDQLFPFIPSP